jgi:hypothetical protein
LIFVIFTNNKNQYKGNEIKNNMSELKTKIISKVDLLMKSLSKFYAIEANIAILLPIVQGTSKISLRILDWFVTNYCKKNNIILTNKSGTNIIVHMDYKNQLKAYAKIYFDPFCRRDRINFIYGKGHELLTTVGQLNFFRWAIENNIIEYTVSNMEIIENDMNTSLKYDKDESDAQKLEDSINSQGHEVSPKKEIRRRKRHELSVSAAKSMSRHNVNIVVEFS